MENDLISKKALLENIQRNTEVLRDDILGVDYKTIHDLEGIIKDAPPVDAAPVVRCKDCMYSYYADNRVPNERELVCERGDIRITPDGFCAWGTPEYSACGPDYCEIEDDGHG